MNRYTVTNRYGIKEDATRYRKPERALRAADKREGDGWEVRDQDGERWDWDQDHKAAILRNW